ncbi:MAG: helix-turn-helix domain-containing protein [Magnetococcales bacterium]|nr:helix-turn-helix domain-containing protein [Magnetococcales bacterium]
MSMTLSDRIQLARKNAGLTQKGLADKVGISQTAVHKLECGRSRSSRRTVSIALTCGVDPIWLDTGRGDMLLPGGGTPTETPGVGEDEQPYRPFPLIARVPLIKWELIDTMCASDDFDQIDAEAIDWIPVAPRTSTRCYALTVPDDSMEPEFSEREILIVDPTQEGVHNQYLVARLEGDSRPTFKQLIILGNRRYLKPLNARYPLIDVEGRIDVCGVVVCKYKDYVL